jgi:hypothetical protein
MSRFMKQVESWSRQVEIDIATITRRTALGILASASDRTPVDKGRARAAWNMNAGENANLQVPPKEYKSTRQAATNEAIGRAESEPSSNVYVVSNNLEYINFLENGSSQQAPAGMLKLAVADVMTELKTSVR